MWYPRASRSGPSSEAVTLGADKEYDEEDFMPAVEERGTEPPVLCASQQAIDSSRDDDRGARAVFKGQCYHDRAFASCQRTQRIDERLPGGLMGLGRLRRARIAGRRGGQHLADRLFSTLNLVRKSILLARKRPVRRSAPETIRSVILAA
ncbi:MAG: hypothetical protein IT439_08070 [Phycisphaerales bacterium]|nr:hypothetical protein [Phycisphaerales bacterium]